MVALRHTARKTGKLVDLKFAHRQARSLSQRNPVHGAVRDRLGTTLDIRDPDLLDRLIRLGIRPENAEAFRYLPIAEVAWGSGGVTERERLLALGPVFHTDLFCSSEAVSLFKSWLTSRPRPALMEAWEEYVALRLRTDVAAEEREFGQDLLQLATRVALASGGIFDQGDICAGERIVLDRISKAYGIDDS